MTLTINHQTIELDADEVENFQSDISDFAYSVVETLTIAGHRGETLTQEQVQSMLTKLNELASIYS